jgi:hypothetical protein
LAKSRITARATAAQGQDQFKTPLRITKILEGGTHAQVEGSNTGIPLRDLTVVKKAADAVPEPQRAAAEEPDAEILQLVNAMQPARKRKPVPRTPQQAQTRVRVRWQQVRAAGATDFVELLNTREAAQKFVVALWTSSKADGEVYVDRQRRDAAGKWLNLGTEVLRPPQQKLPDDIPF